MAMPRLSKAVLALTARPDRAQDFMEEGLFLRTWVEKMGLMLDAIPFAILLEQTGIPLEGKPDLRDMFVASSLVQWFGTNVGIGFLETINDEVRRGSDRRLATLAEWYDRNTRRSWICHGYTTLEHTLNVEYYNGSWRPITEVIPKRCLKKPYRVSPVSERDKAVAEAVLSWFATNEGLAFRSGVEALIEAERARELSIHHQRWNLGILAST